MASSTPVPPGHSIRTESSPLSCARRLPQERFFSSRFTTAPATSPKLPGASCRPSGTWAASPRPVGNSAGTWASWCCQSPLAGTRAGHRSADRDQTMLLTYDITSLLDARFSGSRLSPRARYRFEASPQKPEQYTEIAFRAPPEGNQPGQRTILAVCFWLDNLCPSG